MAEKSGSSGATRGGDLEEQGEAVLDAFLPAISRQDAAEERQEMEGDREAARHGSLVPQLALIWIFSFLKWFKPSEPFLVEYMVSKGFSNSQVYNTIFPIWVYCHLPALILVALISEGVGCKPVVLAGSFLGFVTTALTLGAPHGGLGWLQASQVTVAFSWSSHSAFSALAFGSMPRSKYQMTAHGNRGATLIGSCLSGLLGHMLRPHVGLDWLFRISLLGQFLTFLVAGLICLLSPTSTPDACQAEEATLASRSRSGPELMSLGRQHSVEGRLGKVVSGLKQAGSLLASVAIDIWGAMAVPGVLSWTSWALIGESVHRMVLTYWQNLAKAVEGSASAAQTNGAFYATMYLLAALATLGTSTLPLGRVRAFVQTMSPALAGLLLFVAARGPLINTYAALLLYQCIHEVTAATCSTQVGTEMKLAYATTTSRAIHNPAIRQLPPSNVPLERRLAALFSTTSAVSVLVESVLQTLLLALSLRIAQRFDVMACLVVLLAGLLTLPRIVRRVGKLHFGHQLGSSEEPSTGQHSWTHNRKGSTHAEASTPLLA